MPWFVHGRMTLFNKTMLAMEKCKSSASDVVHSLHKLGEHLQERKEYNFILFGAKILLKSLKEKTVYTATPVPSMNCTVGVSFTMPCGKTVLEKPEILSGLMKTSYHGKTLKELLN